MSSVGAIVGPTPSSTRELTLVGPLPLEGSTPPGASVGVSLSLVRADGNRLEWSNPQNLGTLLFSLEDTVEKRELSGY